MKAVKPIQTIYGFPFILHIEICIRCSTSVVANQKITIAGRQKDLQSGFKCSNLLFNFLL